MSAETQKVDVLAVERALEEMKQTVAAQDYPTIGAIREWIAAVSNVAELIGREKIYRKTIEAIRSNATRSPQCDGDRLHDIVELADAALARIGGAA